MDKKIYIQIGSNVGGDDFFEKIKKISEPSSVHLIEPNVSLHTQLIDCYSDLKQHDIHFHEIGISSKTQQTVLNLYTESGHSSIINRRSHQQKTSEMIISCKSFMDFCADNEITEIEYLCIDTEGLDYDILSSIDLNIVSIKEIIFEEWPYENDDLNETYSTGGKFLVENVLPKYVDYNLEKIVFGGMSSFKLSRKSNN
jgi:FkbM family methyltransferase